MVDTTSLDARTTASSARSSIARPGLIGRGIFYLLFALLAFDLAVGSSDGSEGPVERVASAPFGRFLLIAVVVVLVALVAWKLLQAIVGDPVEGSEPTDRVKYSLKALAYGAVAVSAIAILVANWSSGGSSSTSSSSGNSEEQATATVLEWPAGQWLVVGAGLGIIAFALYELYQYTIESGFMARIDQSSLHGSARDAVEWSGRIGYAGKAAITAVVGIFLVIAGWQHDPDDATGLSGALRDLRDSSWGPALLAFVGIGLLLFAVFSFVEAAYRRST